MPALLSQSRLGIGFRFLRVIRLGRLKSLQAFMSILVERVIPSHQAQRIIQTLICGSWRALRAVWFPNLGNVTGSDSIAIGAAVVRNVVESGAVALLEGVTIDSGTLTVDAQAPQHADRRA